MARREILGAPASRRHFAASWIDELAGRMPALPGDGGAFIVVARFDV